jgi:hypothetical protein
MVEEYLTPGVFFMYFHKMFGLVAIFFMSDLDHGCEEKLTSENKSEYCGGGGGGEGALGHLVTLETEGERQ